MDRRSRVLLDGEPGTCRTHAGDTGGSPFLWPAHGSGLSWPLLGGMVWLGTLSCAQNLESPEAFSAGQGLTGSKAEDQIPWSCLKNELGKRYISNTLSGHVRILLTHSTDSEMYLEANLKTSCVLSHFSRVQLFVTPWTIALQAALSLGFSWQEHWSGVPCFPPGNLPDPEMEPGSLTLAEDSLSSEPPGKPLKIMCRSCHRSQRKRMGSSVDGVGLAGIHPSPSPKLNCFTFWQNPRRNLSIVLILLFTQTPRVTDRRACHLLPLSLLVNVMRWDFSLFLLILKLYAHFKIVIIVTDF